MQPHVLCSIVEMRGTILLENVQMITGDEREVAREREAYRRSDQQTFRQKKTWKRLNDGCLQGGSPSSEQFPQVPPACVLHPTTLPPPSLTPPPSFSQLTQWTDILLVTVAMGQRVWAMHKGWLSPPSLTFRAESLTVLLGYCRKPEKDYCCSYFPQRCMWLWLDYSVRVLASRNSI